MLEERQENQPREKEILFTVNCLDIVLANQFIIKDLNITFSSGQVWGILGPNGSGKTTLLHVLTGLHRPHRGQILLNNQDLFKLSLVERAKRIGLLSQEPEWPFHQTVIEFALTGRFPHRSFRLKKDGYDKKMTEKALELVGLIHLTSRLTYQLSGGERQRLLIATLLNQNPDLYFLDEPTNHLDLKQRHHVLSLFRSLAKRHQKIVVMVLHEPEWLYNFCDYGIIFVDSCKIIAGPIQDIL